MKKLFVLNGGAAVKPGLQGAALHISDPKTFFQKTGINTGDVLVYDATLKQLAYDSISNVQFSHAADEKLWPGDDIAATVIRGSNYLAGNVDLGHVVPLLKKLKGPIVPIGVGAQAGSYGKLVLPKGSVEAWRIIATKCDTIGVRGFYSAEVFNDLGIKNVRVIGCPSFYRSLKPEVKIQKLKPGSARVGVTLNKYLSADYASNTMKTNRMQRALLSAVAGRDNSMLYSQGEREETLAIYSDGPEKLDLVKKVAKSFSLDSNDAVIDLMMNRMKAHFDVDDWATDVGANVDCMMGFRLHGNVIALHQGRPAIFFTYDSRIRELAALFHLPSVEIDDFTPISLDEIMANADFTRFEKAYRNNYSEYHTFLNENNLVNRLPAPTTPQAESPSPYVNKVHQEFTVQQVLDWMLEEVDYMSATSDQLRSRAWQLELANRELKKSLAPAPAAG